ncbi:replication endonuclease, partial [Klebsiella pneumoniae]|nr:replication endonuclease [Klebsiella pneumoniae]
RICTHAMKWKMVRKAVDVQEAPADQGACAPWTRGNNCPPVEKMNENVAGSGPDLPDITGMDERELQDHLHSMTNKELRELNARLRMVKPKRRKGYRLEVGNEQHLQLEYELKSRGFDG